MIREQAQALHDTTVARIDELATEFAALEELRFSLATFIEQPGQDADGVGPKATARTTGDPAPVSHAEAVRNGSRTSADQAEKRGFDSRPPLHEQPGSARQRGPVAASSVATPTPASPSNGAAARDAKLIAAGPYACPGCGREFSRPQGVGRHRASCLGPSAEAPAGEPKNGHRRRSEKFLCGRNCGESFLSREAVRAHEAKASCSPKPTPPPTGREPLGPLSGPGASRSGGFGQ